MARIYLVDDHVLVREGLRAMLDSGGHTVIGESGEPTVAMSDLLRLQPDLLLLDLGLGERSGFELLSELKRRGSAVRTLVLTMSAQPRHVAESVRLGAAGYLLKDSSRADLLQAVADVVAGQRHLGPEVAELAVQALAVAQDQDKDPLAELSPRERQIIGMVVRGRTSPMIAEQLHLSPKTVDTYRGRLMAKLGVPDLPALVRFAIRHGLIEADQD